MSCEPKCASNRKETSRTNAITEHFQPIFFYTLIRVLFLQFNTRIFHSDVPRISEVTTQ